MAAINLRFFLAVLSFVGFGLQAQARGGSSDGTGNFFTASEQQVIDTLPFATLLATNATLDFWATTTSPKDFGKLVPTDLQYIFGEDFGTAMTELLLGEDKIEFKKVGRCTDPHGQTGAASVNTVNGQPHYCLALEILTAIPKDYLPELLASLLIHEVSHVVGKDETTANRAQEWFSNYNKVRLDVARFSTIDGANNPGPGALFRFLLHNLVNSGNAVTPQMLCQDTSTGFLRDLDRLMNQIERSLAFFKFQFPSGNYKREYWVRRFANVKKLACEAQPDPAKIHAEIVQIHAEYEPFIAQFGRLIPPEFIR